MTPRVEKLLHRARRRRGVFWRRRRWVAGSFTLSEGQPTPIRKALALDRVLRRMPVTIAPGELIVGHHPESVPPPDAPTPVGFSFDQRPFRRPEELAALRAGMFTTGAKTGHLTPDYPRLLAEGFGGTRCRVEHRLQGDLTAERRAELEAMRIALDAATHFVHRYARRAARLSSREKQPVRREELRDVAAVCMHIAHRPARNLHEALQLLWFAFLVQCIEEGEGTAAFALGRFDQYLHAFWQADLAAGHQRGDLLELVALFWVKLNEFSGMQVLNLTIGGTDRDGRDAVNDLSFACIELMGDLSQPTPSLSVRWHPGIDADFMQRAVDLAAAGTGQPAFYSDDAVIKAMANAGVRARDAVDAVPGGCVELGVQGRCYPWVGNFLNLPKCLELALHDGVDPASGERVGPPTGTADALDTFERILDAYHRQVRRCLELMAHSENTTDRLAAEANPYPFLSALVDDCIERGLDITAGGARYNFTELQGIGIAHVVDSLLNLRRTVCEEDEIELEELVVALDADFAGNEPLRRRLAGARPAYGDHTEETAAMAREVVHGFFDAVERFENPRGGPFRPGLLVWTLYDMWADCVGALPDGRRRGDALASSIGPMVGNRAVAPTAVVSEATSFDHHRCAGGLTLNLRFAAESVRGQPSRAALVRLIEGYFERGGMQLQLNVANSDVLREAQRDPAAFGDLVVRVSGFSARFVTLSRRIQDEIIARAELAPGGRAGATGP